MENIVLVLFLATWLLLRLEGRGLGSLGFDQPAQRTAQMGVGFLVMALAGTVQQYGLAFQNGFAWQLNLEVSVVAVVAWWLLKFHSLKPAPSPGTRP